MFDTTGLLDPQIPHAERLIDSLYLNGVAFDGSDTGVGKTYVAAAIARVMNFPVVVICPKLVKPMWIKVLAQFGIKASLIINFEKLCRGNTPYLKYNRCQKYDRWKNAGVKLPAGSFVILDESHRCKGVNSLSAGLMIALKRQGYRTLNLSATAATVATEMKAFGYMLNLHDAGLGEKTNYKDCGFNKFCIDHGAEWAGRWGAMTINLESPKVKAAMKRLHINLTDHQKIMSRLSREDMGDYFPLNQIIAETYDMGENSKRIKIAYDTMEDEIAKLEESVEDYSSHIFAKIVATRRKVELFKIPSLVEMTEDLYDEGKSVVVFLNFTESIEAMKRKLFRLEEKVGLVYGGVSVRNRLQDIDDFQTDKKRIILANLSAGGQSLSLHDLNGKYPRASLINPSFSAVNILQATGRIHRVEGKTPCYQRFVFALGHNIEENMCRRLHGRLQNLSLLNDGDLRGGANWFKYIVGKSI